MTDGDQIEHYITLAQKAGIAVVWAFLMGSIMIGFFTSCSAAIGWNAGKNISRAMGIGP